MNITYTAAFIDLGPDAAKKHGYAPLLSGTDRERGFKWVLRGCVWTQQIRQPPRLPPPLYSTW
jgi:hypothetical protein